MITSDVLVPASKMFLFGFIYMLASTDEMSSCKDKIRLVITRGWCLCCSLLQYYVSKLQDLIDQPENLRNLSSPIRSLLSPARTPTPYFLAKACWSCNFSLLLQVHKFSHISSTHACEQANLDKFKSHCVISMERSFWCVLARFFALVWRPCTVDP